MVRRRSSSLWVAGLLLIPLLGISAWLLNSVFNPEPLQVPTLPPPSAAAPQKKNLLPEPAPPPTAAPTTAVAAAEKPAAPPEPKEAELPAPEDTYSPERLFERVNGAADFLISLGCQQLSFWRLEDPPADLEILLFATGEGAGKALAQDAGPDRTPGPGDEAFVGGEAVFFRRGRAYVRLLADPGAASVQALEAAAQRADTWARRQAGSNS